MYTVKIDFEKSMGKIKPMHAINNMPTVPCDFAGLYKTYGEAHIPYARLHDTGGGFGGTHYVDIENIFTNFDADENDPASYDFAFTDALLEAMHKAGVKPFYRLGCTIENYSYIKPYHTFPPKDFSKWARICEHIIMHYNEGWANGFHYDIEYWEIWNEPDNEPDRIRNPMWRGTKEQYYELYDVAAKHLKARFPNLKIGGYAACGFYNLTDTDYSGIERGTAMDEPKETQKISRIDYFVDFFHGFFKYISEHNSPLDFFSWHSYNVVCDIPIVANHIRKNLDNYGYKHAESILNEWNPDIEVRGTIKDMSNIAEVLCIMQHTPTDMCMYYDGNMHSSYGGLFDPVKLGIFKAYYAVKAFGTLYALGEEVYSRCDAENVYVLAAKGKSGKKAIFLLNTGNSTVTLTLDTDAICKGHIVSEACDWADISVEDGKITLDPYSIALLEA